MAIDANDGSSWTLAKKTVQAGIDVALASGQEVWVAAGTYAERITLRSYVYVYGGFAGTETQRSERNWSAHPTVLDGNQGGNVVTAREAGPGWSTIDGFTIRNGKATNGGGIYCSYASPTIANNTITGNSGWSSGGGILCTSSSYATIRNNAITSNSGSGIYCTTSCAPTIAENTITGNSGSGIYCTTACSSAISNNTITGNASAGIYCTSSSAPAIANNVIAGNLGSGIRCASSTTAQKLLPDTGSHSAQGQPSAVQYVDGFLSGGTFEPRHCDVVCS